MAISDADLNWALFNGGGHIVQGDAGISWSPGGYEGGVAPEDARAITQADIDSLRAQAWDRSNPQTLSQAREAGLFGPALAQNPAADEFLSKLFQSKGLNEQQAIEAAKKGAQAHQASFGQGYTPGSSLSGIFNDFIFPAAGVAADPNLETMQGWTRQDAEERGKAAADRNHGGLSDLGLGSFLHDASSAFVDTALGKDEGSQQYAYDTGPLGQIYKAFVLSGGFGDAYNGGAAFSGAGTTGVDASTGQFAGESAISGAAGAGTGSVAGADGTQYASNGFGQTVTDSPVYEAPYQAPTSMPAAQAEPGLDTMGGYNIDQNTGDVFYGTGDNPFGSNFSGGNTNDFFNGVDQVSPTMLQQAQAMAKQFGITPASALGFLKNALVKGAPAALGVIGAKQQQGALEGLAQKYLDFGAPSRARYEASFAPGFTMANDPGYMDAINQSSKASMHALSVNGNPAGSPNAWAQSLNDLYAKTAYPAIQNFRNTNANAGGIASLQTSAPGFDTGAVNAGRGVFDAIGAGANDIFNPKPSLAQTLADYKRLLGTAA